MQQNCKVKELSQIFGYYFTTFAKWPVWCFSLLVFENRAAACVYLDFILYDTVLGENSHFWPKLSDCLLFFFFSLQLLQTSSPYWMPTSFGTYSTQTISGKFIFMRSRANSAFQSLQCLVLCSISWSSFQLSLLAIIALSSYMRSKRSWEPGRNLESLCGQKGAGFKKEEENFKTKVLGRDVKP